MHVFQGEPQGVPVKAMNVLQEGKLNCPCVLSLSKDTVIRSFYPHAGMSSPPWSSCGRSQTSQAVCDWAWLSPVSCCFESHLDSFSLHVLICHHVLAGSRRVRADRHCKKLEVLPCEARSCAVQVSPSELCHLFLATLNLPSVWWKAFLKLSEENALWFPALGKLACFSQIAVKYVF